MRAALQVPALLRGWAAVAALLAVLLALAIYAGFYMAPGSGVAELYEPVKPRIIDHTEYFREANVTRYEGSKTCIECHYDEVVEFFHSYHYQMASRVADIAGRGELLWGGRLAYNDFCMAIFWANGTKPVNWIGYVKLKRAPPGYEELLGSFTGLTGCSMCHGVTMGLPPSWNMTREQLENIDCLACHAEPSVYVSGPLAIKNGYKNVTRDNKGRLVYVVNVPIEKIAKAIIDKPRSENCLACHALSGGGPHLKRPNLSPDMMTKELAEKFDVHLAKGLNCVDCHPGYRHRFPTSSADTWSREEGTIRECSSCHGEKPHTGLTGWIINKFHGRVACQTCHIPFIAHGEYPTEQWRDWSRATFLPEHRRWKFSIPSPDGKADKWYLVGNTTPVYMWYNGTREVYLFPEPVEPVRGDPYEMKPLNGRSLGTIYYVKPLGGRDDPRSKIYPFKLHRAVVPYSVVNKTLVPTKVGVAFATGDTYKAIELGANATGIAWRPGDFVTYVRFMQVNHGVQPADKALFCLDCHGPTVRRMPWPELGYGHYPEIAFTSISVALAAAAGILAYRLLAKRRR